jgi:glycogen(starch) synthase
MRLAYISFEYPPETAYGGIATYVLQASKLMHTRGHEVEVFAASPFESNSKQQEGIVVHRVHCTDRNLFRSAVLPVFSERHSSRPFGLIESPEYYADGLEIKQQFPDLPLVVKLHTPDSFIREMSAHYERAKSKARFLVGALRKGTLDEIYWRWRKKENDIDYLITAAADQIQTPSVSLGDIVSKKWGFERSVIQNVPYPFVPNEQFLQIPADGSGRNVVYIGRLEIRKGIVELVKALPRVFRANPDFIFKFVGKDSPSHLDGVTMKQFVIDELAPFRSRIEFVETTYDEIPKILADACICVFPSIWENFPNVCLEAMSAGKAIVGSANGGMKDMLENPNSGILVNPLRPAEISEGIISLLESKELRSEFGTMARKQVLSRYNLQSIGSLMEKKYLEVISK